MSWAQLLWAIILSERDWRSFRWWGWRGDRSQEAADPLSTRLDGLQRSGGDLISISRWPTSPHWSPRCHTGWRAVRIKRASCVRVRSVGVWDQHGFTPPNSDEVTPGIGGHRGVGRWAFALFEPLCSSIPKKHLLYLRLLTCQYSSRDLQKT